ncbi:MAG: DUF1778 domain-containing protein [Legionella sp.]|nr:DUF1778 domain-containing protein [Legionella sp.]
MALNAHAKTSRIENRCTSEQKHRLQLAAELTGVSTSSFTLAASLEKAEKIISKHAILELTLSDQHIFAEAILSPAEPNKALFQAKNKFQEEVKK